MVQLLHPQKTVNIVTKEGECKINLTIDLNINLNQQVTDLIRQEVKKGYEPQEEEKVDFAIPDFEGSGTKLDFGKKEEAR